MCFSGEIRVSGGGGVKSPQEIAEINTGTLEKSASVELVWRIRNGPRRQCVYDLAYEFPGVLTADKTPKDLCPYMAMKPHDISYGG